MTPGALFSRLLESPTCSDLQASTSTPTVVEHVAAGFDVEMPPFEMRLGSWQLDLPVAAAHGIVNGVVLTSVLAAQQQASIPATVLSVVVPLLFNLEQVRLSASERAVYAELLRDAQTERQSTSGISRRLTTSARKCRYWSSEISSSASMTPGWPRSTFSAWSRLIRRVGGGSCDFVYRPRADAPGQSWRNGGGSVTHAYAQVDTEGAKNLRSIGSHVS
jgi:hypothetical protein